MPKPIEIRHLIRPFEVKQVNMEERTFEGYAAVFGNLDQGGDIIEKGAFTRTINQRVTAGKVKFIDAHISWQGTDRLVGKLLDAREDEYGLWVKIYVSAVEEGDKILTKIQEKVIDALSIGYDAVIELWEELGDRVVRRLKEIRLWEVSAVIFPMNELAIINPDSVKVKSVPPMQKWPLADEDVSWSGSAAAKRCQAWASSDGSGDKDKIDWAKYAKCFFWYDNEDKESFGGYKLGYVDIINSDAKAIPRGILAVAAVLQGARGGVDISEEDQGKIKAQVESWYKKMDKIAPWKGLVFLEESLRALGSTEDAKEGRMLSSANRKLVTDALEVLRALLEASEPPEKALLKAQGLATEEEVQAFMRELELLKVRSLATAS